VPDLICINVTDMRKVAITIMTLSLSGSFILTSPPASAQPGQQQKKAQGQSRRNAVAPRGGARTVTPSATRTASPNVVRTVTPRGVRTVTPRAVRTVIPRGVRTVTPRGVRTVTPRAVRTVIPHGARTVTPRVVAPRVAPKVVTPSGGNAHVVTAGKLRGMPCAAPVGP
jgi:hypothetical protein